MPRRWWSSTCYLRLPAPMINSTPTRPLLPPPPHSEDQFPYCKSLVHKPEHLTVAMEDLNSFDADLFDKRCKVPADYLPLFETAATEVLASLRSKVANESGEIEELTREMCIYSYPRKKIRFLCGLLGAEFMSKLVKVTGITIVASRVKVKATYVTLRYKNCKSIKTVTCRLGLGVSIVPRSCNHVPQPGEEPCPLDPWIVSPNKNKYVDLQTLKLQENPKDVLIVELSRNILLSVDRHLVQTTIPGMRLTVMLIYNVFQASASQKGAVSVKKPYIRVVGKEQTRERNSSGPSNFTIDKEHSPLASDPNLSPINETPKHQWMMLRESLYPLVDRFEHDSAAKVTGMLLEMDLVLAMTLFAILLKRS